MPKNLVRQYFIIILFLSLAISLTIRFPLIMSMIFGDNGDHHKLGFEESSAHFLVELAITFFVALLMFTMNFFILKPVEKHGRMKVLNIVLAVILTVASVYILNNLLFSVSRTIQPGYTVRGHRNEFDVTNFFVSALVIGCVLIIRLIFQKQNIILENEALKREALQSQFESLKNQLSPHFLFNSLTALKILIDEDIVKAQNYVSSLSKALRYILQSNEKQLVTLKQEMDFMDSYLYLIRMRYDTNLSVITEISDSLYSGLLPPLTIQTLVENAIKHNEISKRKPLTITIQTTENGTLRVVNDIQKKLTSEEGTGIGLTNLSKQFQLLIGSEINIREENKCFIVDVPLIKP
jgi:sensor histidine kinase YesM